MSNRLLTQRERAEHWNKVAAELNVRHGRTLEELKEWKADAMRLAERLREECQERDIHDDEALAAHDALTTARPV